MSKVLASRTPSRQNGDYAPAVSAVYLGLIGNLHSWAVLHNNSLFTVFGYARSYDEAQAQALAALDRQAGPGNTPYRLPM